MDDAVDPAERFKRSSHGLLSAFPARKVCSAGHCFASGVREEDLVPASYEGLPDNPSVSVTFQ